MIENIDPSLSRVPGLLRIQSNHLKYESSPCSIGEVSEAHSVIPSLLSQNKSFSSQVPSCQALGWSSKKSEISDPCWREESGECTCYA